jgi:hypothetical protein
MICKHEYGKWSEAFNNTVNQFSLCRQSKICAKVCVEAYRNGEDCVQAIRWREK